MKHEIWRGGKRPVWESMLGLLALSMLVVPGCDSSSGGGGGIMPPPGGNAAPVALIAANPTAVPAGDNHTTVVTLDGSGSMDPDGDPLTYAWTVPSGRFVAGTSSTDPVIQVTFPGAAPYNVTLVVDDGRGGTDSDNVIIGIR